MGSGNYSVETKLLRNTASGVYTSSRQEIFSQRNINEDMSPKGLMFRECRDSEDNPEALPIIIGLDLTGSMGHIPLNLIQDGLPKIMGNILQNGVKCPQVLFVGIGDHECDYAPLQVGQFEASDDLMDKWLKNTYLEQGGGGNGGESYLLAWYVAARYIKTDHWEKRGKKGILVTIGDEPVLNHLPAGAQEEIMGNGLYKDVTDGELLLEASKKWNVFHIVPQNTYNGNSKETANCWKQLLKERAIFLKHSDEIPSTIARIVAENQGVKDVKITDSVEDLKDQDIIL